MRFDFTVPGEPVAKGRPRFRRSGKTYTPGRTILFENLVRLAFDRSGGVMAAQGLPVRITITAYFQIPKSASRIRHDMMLKGLLRPKKKPDADNVLKAVCDALNGVAYYDDAAIVDARVMKYWSDKPRTEIAIETIDG